MILRLVYLKNSTFPSLKITGDTLIDKKMKRQNIIIIVIIPLNNPPILIF